ncbi:hypothetical protein QUB05_09550 [Microcoleus sp. F10-C6]|uniref:hypothetical protein n=1 Tax=unclassified Microcoleus TaxID=2642155 RepID=UPI002FD108DF
MLNNKHLKDWSCIVSQRMAHLSIPQAIGLATWSFGTVMARSSSLTQVSHLGVADLGYDWLNMQVRETSKLRRS